MAKRRGRGALPEDEYLRTRPTLLPGNPVGTPFGGVGGAGDLGGSPVGSPAAPRPRARNLRAAAPGAPVVRTAPRPAGPTSGVGGGGTTSGAPGKQPKLNPKKGRK